jgi:hypothetical protein
MIAFHLRVLLKEEPFLSRTHGRKWDDYVGKVPRWLFSQSKGLLLSWLGVIVLILLAGLTYEAYADRKRRASFLRRERWWISRAGRLHLCDRS